MSVYWMGTESAPEVLALHCDVDRAHDVCTRVVDSIQW